MALYSFDTKNSLLQARLGRLEDIAPYLLSGTTYAKSQSSFTPVATSVVTNGVVNLTNSGVVPGGSIPPLSVNSPFVIVADTANTKATIYWDGTNGSRVPVINRANGTLIAVPANNAVVTGLVASTWYGFLPFWSASSLCGIGFAQGDSGSPLYLFAGGTGASFSATASAAAQSIAIQSQNMQGREPLTSGFATFQMPAAGSTSGSAGGGGSTGRCVMNGTEIEPLGEIDANDMTQTIFPETDWFHIEGRRSKSLNCTFNHPLYHADNGKLEAEKLKVGDWAITAIGMDKITEITQFKRRCTKIQTAMRYGHLYWANGWLSSNVKLY
jgi:hypothetical protein